MPNRDRDAINTILATDCGSTTTKAILIEKINNEWRQTIRGEAPTTVEAPFDDVTIGVINAATEVQELTETRTDGGPKHRFIGEDGKIIFREQPGQGEGVDLYLSTSSAGGGLQMAVVGLVKNITARSASAAALSAGAIVLDALCVDDGRKVHERIARMRNMRPDIVLLAGGADGGNVQQVVELAEMIRDADPRPRFGRTLKLPVIFAGNTNARDGVKQILGNTTAFEIVANLRPTLETENTLPARQAIHECFLEHVMSHAPGYDKLMDWVSEEVMSTPNAVGLIVEQIAHKKNMQVLAVDIGGATTDVFSVFERPAVNEQDPPEKVYNRTVSANLGMSYSMGNVLLEAGIENILRWMPFEISAAEVKNRMRNKMIRPTTVPQTLEDLLVEQAVCREALIHAFEHHKDLVKGLAGVAQAGKLELGGKVKRKSLINLMELNMIVGSGGVLSHAPSRAQSALMMIDAFQPEGFTFLTVDSIFMMPQLGVLSKVMPEAAEHVFERDCIVYLGTVVAPRGTSTKPGVPVMDVSLKFPDGKTDTFTMKYGEIRVLKWDNHDPVVECRIRPYKPFDIGEGPGKEQGRMVRGGVVGLIFDARGRFPEVEESAVFEAGKQRAVRSLDIPKDPAQRVAFMRNGLDAFGLPYPGKK